MATTFTSVVLGKRKRTERNLVIHLSGGSSSESERAASASDYRPDESEVEYDLDNDLNIVTSLEKKPIKQRSTSRRERNHRCSFPQCTKSYTKPSRLREHERSHTGVRPFKCNQCSKTYLRENHLQAHTRVHLAASDRPFACQEENCGKKFWTAQHLKVHDRVHRGEKAFQCEETGCGCIFAKHHQLRTHIVEVHCPPGTKPYRCTHEDCSKSFTTSQKLRAHAKVHDEYRYTCLHPSCRSAYPTGIFFPTWTNFQRHTREVHPPTCPYASCNGRTFNAQKNLRAHLKVHEDKETEETLLGVDADDEDEGMRPVKRRRGGEIGRDWKCEIDECEKAFKSKKALRMHHHITHLKRRDFACKIKRCTLAFGYKHLLERHIHKVHSSVPDTDDDEADSDSDSDSHSEISNATVTPTSPSSSSPPIANTAPIEPKDVWSIDFITGALYFQNPKPISCPWPIEFGDEQEGGGTEAGCKFSFTRAYDLRRHLLAEHGANVSKEKVERWVRQSKAIPTVTH